MACRQIFWKLFANRSPDPVVPRRIGSVNPKPNKTLQRTGASRFAQRQIARQRRLAPVDALCVKRRPMNTSPSQTARPLSVQAALAVLVFVIGIDFVWSAARANWGILFTYLQFGIAIIMIGVPLLFVFRGKNWARWLLVVMAI